MVFVCEMVTAILSGGMTVRVSDVAVAGITVWGDELRCLWKQEEELREEMELSSDELREEKGLSEHEVVLCGMLVRDEAW
jgi:hypothetical protein